MTEKCVTSLNLKQIIFHQYLLLNKKTSIVLKPFYCHNVEVRKWHLLGVGLLLLFSLKFLGNTIALNCLPPFQLGLKQQSLSIFLIFSDLTLWLPIFILLGLSLRNDFLWTPNSLIVITNGSIMAIRGCLNIA